MTVAQNSFFFHEPSPNLTVEVGDPFQFIITYVSFSSTGEDPSYLWSHNNYNNLSQVPEYTVLWVYHEISPTTALSGIATLYNSGLYQITVFDSAASKTYTFQLDVESKPINTYRHNLQ